MSHRYAGGELELFRHAIHWKLYWSSHVVPFVTGSVLEVGAGLGANTRFLRKHPEQPWTCSEPDEMLAGELRARIALDPWLAGCQVVAATIGDLEGYGPFDTILYIDVLEHIEDDVSELLHATSLLREGGSLVVVGPAHQFLFSEFDRSIGHYRRYTRRNLSAVVPEGLVRRRLIYLDSLGLTLSLANRLLLRQALPTERQLRLWDRYVIRLSRRLDPLFGHKVGKTVLGAWQAKDRMR